MLRAIVIGLLVVGIPAANAQESPETGRDLRAVFARAAQGAPLTYVAFGGSITQSGDGWIGSWLRETFPKSCVSVVNSGLSATGSDLGIFR
ncbi:MAG: lysophospholipase, partial [Terrimicrobiaceae bacterium]